MRWTPIAPCLALAYALLAAPVLAPGAGAQTTWRVPTLAPGAAIPAADYARRRQALVREMGDGVLVVPGATEPEADYLPFAQSPAFRYLTGYTEPGAALVIAKRGGTVTERLFVLPRDPAREVWEGSRMGAAGAQAATGIPAANVSGLFPAIDSLLAGQRQLYTVGPAELDRGVLTAEQQVLARIVRSHPGVSVTSLGERLARLRASKTPVELDLIRRAVHITALAHRAAMRAVSPGQNEFEIHGLVEYVFRRNGADRPSFASIIGSGPNSTTLHYRAADRFMEAGETVVLDIGASYRGYAADVTRTLPVSGTFTPDQRAIYEIVLAAQKAAERDARPGATLQGISTVAARQVAEGLTHLGLIESATAVYDCGEERTCPQYQLFYMHGLGHGIGLEVHDPELAYFGPFGVGSAFTIEPGIYVRGDVLDHLSNTARNRALRTRLAPAVARYRNIGVRIEDDYFITPGGVERVSNGAPREIAEIEALMREETPLAAERERDVVEWYRQTAPR